MARGDIEAGRAFVRVTMNDSSLIKGIKAAQRRLASFGRAATLTGAAFTGAGAAITGPLVAMAKGFASAGDAAGKMSARTGVGAEAIQELKFAAEQSGSSIEAIEKGMAGLSRSVYDASRGSAEASEAFEAIGLSFRDLEGLTPDEQLSKVADGLSGIQDASKKTAIAQKLLGKSGRDLIPLLNGGAEGMAALRQEARDLNLPLTDEEVATAEALTDSLNRMTRSSLSLANILGSAIAEPMGIVADLVAKTAATIGKWVRENKKLVAGLAAGGAALVAAGAAITGIGIAASLASVALGGIVTVIGAIGTVAGVIVSPIGIATAALAAGVTAWLKWTDAGKQFADFARQGFQQALTIAKDTIGGIVDALKGGNLQLAAKIAFAGLKLAVAEGFNGIAKLVGGSAGDVLGATFTQLFNGDFKGAFETAVEAIKAQFLKWGSGIVSGMRKIADSIVDIWRKVSESIANAIYDAAESNPVIGKALSLALGVDLSEEARKGAELDRRRAIMREKLGIENAGQDSSGRDGINAYYNELEEELKQQLESLDEAVANAADDARNDLKQRVTEIGQIDTSDLAAQLAELRAQASKEAEEAAKKRANVINDQGGEDGVGTRDIAFGSFSAAALARMAGGYGGPQKRMLSAAEKQVAILQATKKVEDEILRALRSGGLVFG